MINFKNLKSGFTLAEVLITLGIIGVVAAMTLPTLIANYQKNQVISQLKKAYSTLAQAFTMATTEYESPEGWDISGLDSYGFIQKYLYPYLNIAKDCGTETTGNCEFKVSKLNSDTYENFGSTHPRFYLNDGTLIALKIFNQDNQVWTNIYIDVNGNKNPNKYGKDIFMYNILFKTSNTNLIGKFLPVGAGLTRAEIISNSKYGCSKNVSGTNAGTYCSALIMTDGWHMAKDYPW